MSLANKDGLPSIADLLAASANTGAAVGSSYISNFGPTTITIPATKFGAKFDNVTDDTAAIQAALDAASVNAYSAGNINDYRSIVVQLPPGTGVITAPLKMHPNTILRGHGPFGTLLWGKFAAASQCIQLATGFEVSCEVRDLGVLINDAVSDGINFTQVGQASALSDARHRIENIVVLNGRQGIVLLSGSECRVVDVSLYYQSPHNIGGALSVGGTDGMIERVTVAQVAATSAGAAVRAGTSNTRFVNCKIFGGQVGASGGYAFYLIGQRNQIIGLEVQDARFSLAAVRDDQGYNVFSGLVVDSCQGHAFSAGGPSVVRGGLFVNRGGTFTMPSGIDVAAGMGADIEAKCVGLTSIFSTGGNATAAGNRYIINQEFGVQSVAFATPLTPDPYVGGTYIIGTVTGTVTINAPATTFTNAFHLGQQLSFWITQDGTGHAVTWNAAYHLTGAFANAASSVTKVTFEFDGTVWREVARTVTT